jgi:signal transduction histidine kinase
MKCINLFYGSVHALKGVDFDLFGGEIHALVGTHRAGKSSLMKILSGANAKFSGDLYIRGKKFDSLTTQTSIQQGIGMMYQEPSMMPSISTLENLFLGNIPRKWYGGVDWKKMKMEAALIENKFNLKINCRNQLHYISPYEQNLVEIVRLLLLKPEILILDEVSNRFTPSEMENIYPLISEFKDSGRSIIYISHNMEEILRVADRVTILKDGISLGTESIMSIDKMRLIKLTYSFTMSREELEKENLQLFYLKKYNEDILKNIPIGVIILNPQDNIYMVNDTALEILNLRVDDYTDYSIDLLLQSSEFTEKEEFTEKLNLRQQGILKKVKFASDKALKINIIPFRDDDDKFLGTIVLLEDITQELNLKEYLSRTEKISSIAELAAGVAHEINNPLGILQNHIDILKVSNLEDDSIKSLENIEKEILRISGIVGNLLSFSKTPNLNLRKVNIISILKEVLQLLEPKFMEKSFTVHANYDFAELNIVGDENKLKQLFINLFMNSLEAIIIDGEIVIGLSERVDNHEICVKLRDNGPGIPKNIMQNIFNPFFSTKQSRKNAGLGLSICHYIVEVHKGTIRCSSKPGQFTCFEIILPSWTEKSIGIAG